MTMIELGDLTSGSPTSPAPAAPEFDRRILRRLAVAAVAVLTLLTVAGSARPEARLLRTLWSIQFDLADRYGVSADTVYAATLRTGGRLIAYDLSTGARRWSRPMPEPSGWPNVAGAGVVLLQAQRVAEQVYSDDGGSYLNEYFRQTVAVDARTGRELWRRPGDFYVGGDDTALLMDPDDDGSGIAGMRLVRLRDGAVLWSRTGLGSIEATTAGADPRRPAYLVIVHGDGLAEVIRWTDGVTVVSARIGWRNRSPFRGVFSELTADDRNVYVRLADGRGSSLAAYTLDGLRPRWRVADTGRVAAYPCGAVVCSIANDGFAAYDPATGQVRWRAVGVRNASPVSGGRLLVADGADDAYALLDGATGRRVASLGLGQPVGDDRTGTVLLLRNTESPAGRTAVSRVDPRTGRVSVRGTVDRITDDGCSLSGDRIVCPTVRGRLVVTEIAP